MSILRRSATTAKKSGSFRELSQQQQNRQDKAATGEKIGTAEVSQEIGINPPQK